MEDHIPVRVARPEDAATISALLYDFNGEALPPDQLAQRMAEADGLETAFVAQLGGRPAGLLVLRTVPTLSDPSDMAEITELYVEPSARRRGVGRSLVGAALHHARQRGCHQIHLLANSGNRSALAFYQALGFERDSWAMRRTL
jgi:ribosomal protein S18 acetylase RimI-like enzyme